MKPKEIIIAVIIGLAISGLIAGGILRAQQALHQFTPHPSSTSSPSPSLSQATPSASPQQLFLDITSPQNNIVSSQATITLQGKTLPHTYIAILTDNSEYLIVPNNLGQFSQDIQLIKGANIIKITVYDSQGHSIQKTLNLVYTTKEI